MKYGRTLTELAQEIERQNNAKRDYLVDTTQLTMGLDVTGDVRLDIADSAHTFGLNEVAHQQIGQQMGIPLPYYRRMLSDAPGLLATNVNHMSIRACSPSRKARSSPALRKPSGRLRSSPVKARNISWNDWR